MIQPFIFKRIISQWYNLDKINVNFMFTGVKTGGDAVT